MIDSEVTLLPQPDSPTKPRVLPSPISKLTPSMARTSPSGVKKEVCRSLTWSKSGMMGAALVLSRSASTDPAQHARVENVADSISHSIKSQDCQHDEQPRKDRHNGMQAQVRPAGAQHAAPGWQGRIDSEAEKAQARFGGNRARQAQARQNQDRRQDVGQEMAPQKTRAGRAQ